MFLALVFSEVEAAAEVVTKVVSERVEGVFLLLRGLFVADVELVEVCEVVELVFSGLCGFRCVFAFRGLGRLLWLLRSPRWRVRVQVLEVAEILVVLLRGVVLGGLVGLEVLEVVLEVDLVGLVVGVVEFVQILQIFQVVEV